jgi:hypothetical protein
MQAQLTLFPPWRERWLPTAALALMALSAFMRLAAGPSLWGGPDPLGHRWSSWFGLLVLIVSSALIAVNLNRLPGGSELRVELGCVRFRELQTSFFHRFHRTLIDVSTPLDELRYLESQHGVILKGPEFHRDLILPKKQTQELIDWLGTHGVQRFSMDVDRQS